MVAVYNFKIWDQGAGDYMLAPRKATGGFIEAVGGEIIPDTEEQIDPSKFDPEGRYGPLPERDNVGLP